MSDDQSHLGDAIESVLDLDDLPDECVAEAIIALARLKAGIDSCD